MSENVCVCIDKLTYDHTRLSVEGEALLLFSASYLFSLDQCDQIGRTLSANNFFEKYLVHSPNSLATLIEENETWSY
jgi:hypothetical protein